MDFRHQFLGDIIIELISPSGQVVQLIGPGVSVSGNTSFTRWNVTFVPCTDSPNPDAGFFPVWDNLQSWGLFGNYIGQYHPFLGCLEDFDTGLVNGTWTLRVIDVSQFGSGRIQNISLFFCNDEGIECNECTLDPGILSADTVSQCQNSSDIILTNYAEIFPLFPKDTVHYFYKWAIFRDSTWISLIPQDVIPSLPVGSYSVCNVQLAKIEESQLPSLPVDFDSESLNQYFIDQLLCASVSQNCISIHIYPTTDTIRIDTTLCAGDELTIYNQSFDEQGIYTIQIPGQFCDTIVVVQIGIFDLNASITNEADTLSCQLNKISLLGEAVDTLHRNLSFTWFTTDGLIETTADSFHIFAKNKGTYFMVVSDGICVDTTSVELYLNDEYPQVQIVGDDTLTCSNDTILLLAVSNQEIQSVLWSSSAGFIQLGNDIKVFNFGEYFLEITNTDGCIASTSIFIHQINQVDSLKLIADTITCTSDSVFLQIQHSVQKNYLYSWTGVEMGYENSQNPLVTYEGIKQVLITDIETGCFILDSVQISDVRKFPVVTIDANDLTCNRDSVVPIIHSDILIRKWLWTGPGLSLTDSTVSITTPGLYSLLVTTIEECMAEVFFTIQIDTSKALITVYADTLDCVHDSIIVRLESDKLISEYFWFGPSGNIVGRQDSLVVFVAGIYTLVVIDEDSCSAEKKIEVHASGSLPNIVFSYDEISCVFDTIQIVPDKFMGYSFLWEFPDASTSIDPQPYVNLQGTYKVTITDETNPECKEYQAFDIVDIREYPQLDILYGYFSCLTDSVLVQIIPNIDSLGLEVVGPSIFLKDDFEFYVHSIGTYYVSATSKNGCMVTDSFEIVINDRHPIISIIKDNDITCENQQSKVHFQSDIQGTTYTVFKDMVNIGTGSTLLINTPGEYILYGSSPNACMDTLLFTVEIDTVKPDVMVLPFDTIDCNRLNTALEAISNTQGATIKWTNSVNNPFIVSLGGFYSVRATNPLNGCFNETTVQVVENKVFAEYVASATKITCKSPISTLSVIKGNHYFDIQWSTNNPEIITQGTTMFATAKAGKYYFEVLSSENCNQRDSIEILVDTMPPIIQNINIGQLTCIVKEVDISITTPSNLDSILFILPSGETINKNKMNTSVPGNYGIKLFGANGCVKDTFVNIIENYIKPQFTVFSDSLSCKKGKGVIGVNTTDVGLLYSWSGPDQFTSVLSSVLVTLAGDYTVLVTNVNGCQDSVKITVNGDYAVPEFSIKDSFLIPCDTSFIILNLESQDVIEQYNWTYNGNFFSNEQSPTTNKIGQYSVIVTGRNGCRASKSFEAIHVTLPVGFSYTTDTITCRKREVVLSAFSPHSMAEYTWLAPSGNISISSSIIVSEAGQYQLIIKDENKCLDTIVVEVPTDTITPFIFIDQQGQIICNQRSAQLYIPDSLLLNQYSYMWQGNTNQILSDPTEPMIHVMNPGIFRVSVFNDKNGCVSSNSYTLMETESDFMEIGHQIINPPCVQFNFGSLIIQPLGGVSPYRIKFNGIEYVDTYQYNLLKPGIYNLSIEDSLGCVVDTLITIKQSMDILLTIPTDTIILLGDSVVFTIDLDSIINLGFHVIWLEKNDTICTLDCQDKSVFYPASTTIYTLILESSNGRCRYEKKVFVTVRDEIFSGIPNAIYIHAEKEENRFFYIPQIRGIREIISLEIFDKWANPVFAKYGFPSGNLTYGWDGSFNGEFVESGVYIVLIKLALSNGNIITYEGDVTVFK
ncbi:MAG: hypothetical protein WAT79_16260 [Saprospiraceae bacterium]